MTTAEIIKAREEYQAERAQLIAERAAEREANAERIANERAASRKASNAKFDATKDAHTALYTLSVERMIQDAGYATDFMKARLRGEMRQGNIFSHMDEQNEMVFIPLFSGGTINI